MANSFFVYGARGVVDRSIDLVGGNIKVMAIDNTYSFDASDQYVSDLGAVEIVATNYTGGFGGAGRIALASKSFSTDLGNERAEFTCAAWTWTALGGAVNDTIGAYVIFLENVSDAASPLIAFFDTLTSGTLPLTTNGSDVTVNPNAEGLLQFPITV